MNYIFKGNSYSSIFLTNKDSIKKLLIVTSTIPSCGFILMCLHKLCACDFAIPSTALGTKNHRHPSKNQQTIWCRQGLQRVFVQSSLISHISKHSMSSFYCYSSKLNDKCDTGRGSWKWHRQKERARDKQKEESCPLENIQSETEQSRCLRRRELEREPKWDAGLQGQGWHLMVHERQRAGALKPNARASTVQISTACLATPRKFAVNEEYSPTDDSVGSCLFSARI